MSFCRQAHHGGFSISSQNVLLPIQPPTSTNHDLAYWKIWVKDLKLLLIDFVQIIQVISVFYTHNTTERRTFTKLNFMRKKDTDFIDMVYALRPKISYT